MGQNPQPPDGANLLKALIDKINIPVFLFAIAIIVALALFGSGIPVGFHTLINVVVIGALLAYLLLAFRSAARETNQSSTSSPPLVNTSSGAVATHGGVAASQSSVSVGGNMYGDIHMGASSKTVPPEGLRQAYLNWLLNLVRSVPLAGVDPKSIIEDARTDIDLAAVYTALLTQRTEAQTERGAAKEEDVPAHRLGREVRRLSALTVLNAEKYLALLGEPGSGKSTFVNFVALCLAGEGVGHSVANLKTLTTRVTDDDEDQLRRRDAEQPAPEPWKHGALIPVRVVLRDFVARDLAQAGQSVSGDLLWRFIIAELPETLREFSKPLRDELLKTGGLILLDGLDEVSETEDWRAQVKAVVQNFAAAFPQVRVLVTSRTYAYQKQAWKLDGFTEAVLAPFGPPQIRRFVESWYAHVGPARKLSTEDAQGRAVVLNQAIERSANLSELAMRPLLLTLMASLHAWRGGKLPDQREELYADAVDLLLDQWESQKLRRRADGQVESIQPGLAEWLNVDRQAVRKLLDRLAFEAQRDQPELVGTADIPQDKLVNQLMQLNPNPDARPQRLVEYISVRAGLLEPRGVGVYAFPHRTFQEYLAACHLTDHGYPDDLAALLHADANRWREVVLLAGAKAARGTASAVWMLAEALCDKDYLSSARTQPVSDADNWAALLAAQVLIENQSLANMAERNRPKVERIRQWLLHIVTDGVLPPVDRAQAGRALGLLGDPRDFDELVSVPAGKFWMGSDKEKDKDAYDDELPQHEVSLAAFKIGKYPVTVGQWRRFVQSAQYEGLENALSDPDNHPVRYVSWHDAQAYCRWLTQQWRTIAKIKQDEVVRLPTEAEWEKAARGTDKRLWPWEGAFDADKANTAESGIGDTCAVGCFPGGVSQYGCLDMAGNLFEWTTTWWGKEYDKPDFVYPYDQADGRENPEAAEDMSRVVRGGAWNYFRNYARCAFRDIGRPGYRGDFIGFRIVVSPGSRS